MKSPSNIYLDHQASTPAFEEVVEAMLPFWRIQHSNPHSSEHAAGWTANKAVMMAREQVANMIGALPSEIIFTSGATEANNLVLFGLAASIIEQVVTSEIEHVCVMEAAAEVARERNIPHITIPSGRDGKIDLDALRRTVGSGRSLVSVGLVNNEIGTIQDLEKISQITREGGATLHTDAAQSPFAIDLRDLTELVDAASFSGHKMGGPMGIGALYLSADLHSALTPRLYGGGQENGLRSGTLPLPLCVGFGKAAEIVSASSFGNCRDQMRQCRDVFLQRLFESNVEFAVNGAEFPSRHPGNLNIQFPGEDAQDLLLRLQPRIAASTGSACSSGKIEPSHVLKAIGLSEGEAGASLRISFGPSSSQTDVNLAAKVVVDALLS